MDRPNPTLTSADLTDMLNEARLFQCELARFRECEAADGEPDPGKRLDRRRRIVKDGFVWGHIDFTPPEIDLLYGMAREVARMALARRSAAFQRRFGIALSCGEAPSDGRPHPEAPR